MPHPCVEIYWAPGSFTVNDILKILTNHAHTFYRSDASSVVASHSGWPYELSY